MNIWIFQTGEPLPTDQGKPRAMRAMNLAKALVESGHTVTLWSSGFNHQEKKHRSHVFQRVRVKDKLEVLLVPSTGYKKNISLSRLFDHLVLALNLRKELAFQTNIPDVAFVGYPPIEATYVMLAWLRSKEIPALLDVKDQWPSVLVQSAPKVFRPIAYILLAPYYFIARRTMRRATGICAMSDSFLSWALSFAGRERISFDRVVPLTSVDSQISNEEKNLAREWWLERGILADKKCRIMFVGSFSRAFDFDAIFVAAGELLQLGLDCEFILCGDGDLTKALQAKGENYPNITFVGWIDRAKIIALAECSSAAIAPYNNSSDFVASIPNKVIDAFLLGLPLLSPLQGEVAGLIEAGDVGLSYGVVSGKSLASCVREIAETPGLQQKLAKNSRALYEKRFSYGQVYGGLVKHLEEITIVSNRAYIDKMVERKRYDTSSENLLSDNKIGHDNTLASHTLPVTLRKPYVFYENYIKNNLNAGSKVLEIGAGAGAFTGVLLSTEAEVHATDISASSLKVIEKRFGRLKNLKINEADMEKLPFENETFDVVTSAGSLSYGDNAVVMGEIYRVVKKGGVFICVDSLNDNPIYRLNRWVHYLRGDRTASTLKRMPTVSLIENYRKKFGEVKVQYFGSLSWIIPFLSKIVGERKAAMISDYFDELFSINKSGFKFVMIAKKAK